MAAACFSVSFLAVPLPLPRAAPLQCASMRRVLILGVIDQDVGDRLQLGLDGGASFGGPALNLMGTRRTIAAGVRVTSVLAGRSVTSSCWS